MHTDKQEKTNCRVLIKWKRYFSFPFFLFQKREKNVINNNINQIYVTTLQIAKKK